MAELSIGGETFHVQIEGDENAPVLMLSNALGTNLHMWDPQVPAFLEHYRVLRYDPRGHGNSVVTDGPYSIAQLGLDAIAILDELGIEKIHFVGLSLGGVVGQWLLAQAPGRIEKAVLANTAAQIGTPDGWNSRIHTVSKEGPGAVAASVIEQWFTRDFREAHPQEVADIEDMIVKTSREGYVSTCAALRDVDLREAVRSIDAPVLVIVARHDTVTPPGIGALISSSIPNAKLATLEAAHLSNIQDTEQFTATALGFLLADTAEAETIQTKSADQKTLAKDNPMAATEDDAEIESSSPAAAPPAAKPAKKGRVKKIPSVETLILDELAKDSEPVAVPLGPDAIPAALAPLPPTVRKSPQKKAAPKKKPAPTAAVKKAAPKKAAPKKAAVKKAAPKKAVAKKAAPKKVATKKAAPKKAVKKSVPKKAAAKKTAVRKTVVRKTTAKKAAARRGAVQKAPVKKSVPQKLAAKKALPSRKTGPAKGVRKPVKKPAAKTSRRR